MKTNFLYFYTLILMGLGLLMTSCSSSNHTRTGRYSSADKRERGDSKPAEEKQYTYHPSKKEISKESIPLKVSELRKDIINTALNYQGTSYRSGGKSPSTGFDCSGFTRFIFAENGISISGSSDKIAQMGKLKSREDLLPGDLVFFGNSERISHVAIVSDNRHDNLEVVHATTSSGVKVDTITGYNYWESRYLFGKDIITK